MPDKGSVFVDSSIWIDFFREADNQNSIVLKKLLEEDRVSLSHVVISEIVPFITSEKEQKEIKKYFQQLKILPFEDADWDALISLRCLLQMKGITGSTIPDLIITALCLKNNIPVFSEDKHFRLFSKAVPLKIYED